MRRQLPFVYINVAMTADGKLAPANRRFVPFGGKRDRELLLELRARADAVMSGARTVDASPVNLGPGPARYRQRRLKRGLAEYNLRVIVSGSGTINPNAEIFKHRFSPIIVLTSRRATRNRLARLRDLADEVKICGEREIDFIEAVRWLRKKWQVTRLLCEGGGEVNGALFRAGLVHEVYVTVCPLILGGRSAPTLADGNRVEVLAKANQLELKSAKRAGAEMYLIYTVRKRAGR
jgi:riboflavin-specific deaminase-like protein